KNLYNAQIITGYEKNFYLVSEGQSQELLTAMKSHIVPQQPPQQMQQLNQQMQELDLGDKQQQQVQEKRLIVDVWNMDLENNPPKAEDLKKQITQQTLQTIYDTRLATLRTKEGNWKQGDEGAKLGQFIVKGKKETLEIAIKELETKSNKYLDGTIIGDLELQESLIVYVKSMRGGKGADFGQEFNACINYVQEMLGVEDPNQAMTVAAILYIEYNMLI
ncbi:MAG: hypothetical protein ACTSXG_01175, partial [Alphaproteobacteria bacterium]